MAVKESHPPWDDLLVAFTLLAAGWRYTYGLEHSIDIGLYDESNYLFWGVSLPSAGFPEAESAPLYAVWYFVLSLLCPDRVTLYYANCKVLTWLLPIAVYTLLRRYRVSVLPATVVSFLILISPANLPVWPKVTHFSLLLILTFLILASYAKSLNAGTALTCVGALLSSYVRPEMFLSFALFALLYAGLLIADLRKRRPPDVRALATAVLSACLLLVVFGVPVGGGRSLIAFGQHFSLNWVRWARSDLNPWTDWGEILNQNFGHIQSLAGAASANPSAFAGHLAGNIMRAPARLLDLFYWHTGSMFPSRLHVVQACALLVSLSVYACVSGGRLFSRLREENGAVRVLWLCCFSIPPLMAAVIIFPRDHYLLLPGVFIFVGVATFALGHRMLPHLKGTGLTLLSVLIVTLVPGPSHHLGRPPSPKHLETIRILRSLRITEEVNMLEAEGGYHIYLGDNFHRVAEYDKATNFNAFLCDKRIGVIVVTSTLRDDSRFKGDDEWQDFLINYEALGYRMINTPGNRGQIIVDGRLLRD